MPWGQHLIVNAGGCVASQIRSKLAIQAFARTLVREIDMVAYGEPQVIHFGSGNKAGFTLVQLIETSNICAHFVEETNDMYLDVFSCKEFDPDTVKKVVCGYFSPRAQTSSLFIRQAPELR